MKAVRLTATKRERLRREENARLRKAMKRPEVKAKMVALAEAHFREKFDRVWPHIRKGFRMDQEAAWVAFLADVVACRAYHEDPPLELRRLSRELAKPKGAQA